MQERKIESQQSRCQVQKDAFRCELISFNEVLRLSRILTRKIKASGYMPDLIVAIGRGGYVPGRLVSDFLLFNDLASMKIEHYSRAADMISRDKNFIFTFNPVNKPLYSLIFC